jgi:hypothetical protein
MESTGETSLMLAATDSDKRMQLLHGRLTLAVPCYSTEPADPADSADRADPPNPAESAEFFS